MLIKVSLVLTVLGSVTGVEISETRARDPRFFGLFNIVSFPNNACKADNDKTGLCFTGSECSSRSGEARGDCANGFGVCCVFIHTCGMGSGVLTLDNKVDYLENANYPQEDEDPSMCLAQIQPCNENICQIRIDFEDFEMDAGSEPKRPCNRDSVKISSGGGSDLGIGDLCGDNIGQHIYIPVKRGMGGASIRISTSGRGTAANITQGYKWKMKVTQLDCKDDFDEIAPDGCIQYHTEQEGMIKSFNFDPMQKVQYPLNLDYAYCFKKPDTACEIKFARTMGLAPFTTSVGKMKSTAYTENVCGKDNGCGAKDNCIDKSTDEKKNTGDYLLIPGGMTQVGKVEAGKPRELVEEDFFCGVGVGYDGSNDPGKEDGTDDSAGVVSKAVGPVLIKFHSDDKPGLEDGTGTTADDQKFRDELGFSLMYSYQASCTNQ